MNRFPVLSNLFPEKKRFFDRQKLVYLKAVHKELPITLLWMEQSSLVGRHAYPCVYKEEDSILAFIPKNTEASAPLEEKWAALTADLIASSYEVTPMNEKDFFAEYKSCKEAYWSILDSKNN